MPLTAKQALQQQQQMAVPVKAGIAIATGENLEQACWSYTAEPSLYDTATAILDPPRFLLAFNLATVTLPRRFRTALSSLRAALPQESPPCERGNDDPITPMLDLLLDETRCESYSLDFSKRSRTQTLNQIGLIAFLNLKCSQ